MLDSVRTPSWGSTLIQRCYSVPGKKRLLDLAHASHVHADEIVDLSAMCIIRVCLESHSPYGMSVVFQSHQVHGRVHEYASGTWESRHSSGHSLDSTATPSDLKCTEPGRMRFLTTVPPPEQHNAV
jgi:hypothetical protein